MPSQQSRRRRREQLEALLAGGQARLERARSRSLVVDTMVGVVRRDRPVAVGILAASLAFRLFALVVPLSYVAVAGLGFAGQAAADTGRPEAGDRLGELVISSVAAAARSSHRARWLALILGGVATLLAAAAVLEVLRWVHLLAWRMPPARGRARPWLVLGLVAGIAVVAATSAVAEQARAGARGLATELTVVLVSAGAQALVLAVLWLALSLAMPRPPAVPWTALVPGACLFAAGFQGYTVAVGLYFAPRAARASTVYGSLGVALVLLVSLFLFARLAVAAAELNATMEERRRPTGPAT
ncbi:MAG TPA: YhjD/YihY/BrkB family envelope integrity protein [Actinomycetes bacterium]|nr:YhjD/YihY/BrkB family envelope integrity protein [Actinomycetes bacterium]